MKLNKAPNVRKQKPFTTASELDSVAPLDSIAAPFAPSAVEVADRAYLKFQNQGASDGYDVEHWLRAEAELIAEHDAVGK